MFLPALFTIGIIMPDPKLLEAYRMAQQMDRQQVDENRAEEDENISNFLKAVGQVESSGGRNFNHERMTSGMHKGHRASGTYGFMPNTVTEVLNMMRMNGQLTPDLEALQTMKPDQVSESLENNPEQENKLARHLAKYVLDRQQDPEKAAYSWNQGHNLKPEDIDKRDYKEHDYVKKYNKYRGEHE
jgi:hypothetical protein